MRGFCLVPVLLLAACEPGAETSQTATAPDCEGGDVGAADDVLACHIEAMGGADAIAALRNVHVRPEVVEQDFTVTGDYWARADGRMRVDIYMDDRRVFSEGIDEAGGWQQAGEGAEVTDITDPVPFRALERGIEQNLMGLWNLEGRGHRADYLGREGLDGTRYHVLHVTDEHGFERRHYIDPDSWMIARVRETSALHPDLDPEERPAETRYSDFRPECGVVHAMRTEKVDLETGDVIQATRPLAFACNLPEEALSLERPSDS